jgi:hypothetical protein
MSKARAYLDILMGKHFNRRSNVSLATPGMEDGKEVELKYEGVRGELNDEKNKEFYEQKLKGILKGKNTFEEFYCSREEGLLCMDRSCVGCGEAEVKRNADCSVTK